MVKDRTTNEKYRMCTYIQYLRTKSTSFDTYKQCERKGFETADDRKTQQNKPTKTTGNQLEFPTH